MHRLPLMVAETDVDKTVDVGVIRKGQPVTLKVKVGELSVKDTEDENDTKKEPATPATPNVEKIDDLGVSVAPLTDALRTRFDIKKGVAGVVVTALSPDSVAADQGVQVGDVISEASQQEVKATKDVAEAAKQAKKNSKPLLLLINRKDDLQFVAINFGKKK